MKTGIIVQGRLGSKRFPRKVLADLNGKTVLRHVIERCRQIGPQVILATPDWELCDSGAAPFIGSEHDVLWRYLGAANAYGIDIIMRITADCPLIQPDLCQKTLELYHKGHTYAALDWPRGGFPKGYGCEVFSRELLEEAHKSTQDQYDREHVTPWMQRQANCAYLENPNGDESATNYCVDTKWDLERLNKLLKIPEFAHI